MNEPPQILRRFPGTSVLVVGDVMLDEYLLGTARRLSPEAPVPVVEVEEHRVQLGGAANVAANVAALGARVMLVGAVGADPSGARLRHLLGEIAGAQAHLFECDDRPTTTKTRIVAQGQQIVRVDREARRDVPDEVASALIGWVAANLGAAQCCVLSDYAKGLLTGPITAEIIARCREARVPVVVDPKGRDFTKYRGASVITPNLSEARHAAGAAGDRSLGEVGEYLVRETAGCAVIITRGADGLTIYPRPDAEGDCAPLDVPARPSQVFDLTGAGDTLVATLAVTMAAGADLSSAASIANHAAGLVVSKFGAATVSLDELADELTRSGHP